MVSILPPERNAWDVISKAMGQQISQHLPGAVQQGYNRQLGMNALDNLEKALQDPSVRGDPYKIALEFAKAGAQNPNLQRSLGPLMQTALTQSATSGIGSGLVDAGNTPPPLEPTDNLPITTGMSPPLDQLPPRQITSEEVKGPIKEIDSIANQYIGEVRPDLVDPSSQYGAINTFDAAVKQDLTPEEEGKLRNKLLEKYKNPSIVDPVVERVREGIRNKYNESLSKYNFDKDKINQIKEKWNDFTQGSGERLKPHVSKYEQFPRTQEILKNKYNQYAGKLQTNLTPEQMHANSMELLQRDINKIDALHASPPMPPVRTSQGFKDYIDTYKDSYKDLYEKGFVEALREDAILNKDMGNEEFHSMIWGDQTNKHLLNSLNALKAPIEYSTELQAIGGKKYNKYYPQQREKYINDISKKLMKLDKKDDLVLARAMVLDQGGEVKDFLDALNKSLESGLKLSEFQKSQLQEIHIPRVPPLWQVFGKSGAQPFINYLRGKK